MYDTRSTRVRAGITVLLRNNGVSATRFRSNVLLRAVLSNIRECFNCAFNWIDLTSPGQQHRKTRRPWPQPADGQQDVGRCNPAHSAHQCWYVHSCLYDLTYEATSRFFRTGREQEQEDTGHLECLDDREFPRGYCRDFSRRNVRIGRLARRTSFSFSFLFSSTFSFSMLHPPRKVGSH